MEICAVNNFHKLNNQKYCIVDNKEFLIWYNKVLTLGYKSIYSVKDFQVLIDQIVSFFEMKIQDRILENSIDEEENKSIQLKSTYLSHQELEELKKNLPPKIVNLLDCHIEPYVLITKDTKRKELESILFQYDTKINLRNKILELIPIAILTSPNTIPKYGYIRAKKFINTFNKEYNLNLTTTKIDELINSKYYSNIDYNPNEPLIKRLTKKFNVKRKH